MANRRSTILAAAGLLGAPREDQRIFWQKHNAIRRPTAKRLDALATETLAASATDMDRLAAAWREAIPREHHRHCIVERLLRGTLTVVVDSAATRYVLSGLCGATILPALRAELGESLVRRIVFRVGAIKGRTDSGSEDRIRSK